MGKTKIDYTKTVLQNMFTENTGEHMLDSGGAYGRHFQRNVARKIWDEPYVTFDEDDKLHEYPTINCAQFLYERLNYDATMNAKLVKFSKAASRINDSWFEIVEEWLEYIGAGKAGDDFGGPNKPINTYNHDSALDQTIQYWLVSVNDIDYVVLMVHGGCDVRGGYTSPKVFRCNDVYSMFDDDCDTARNLLESQIDMIDIKTDKYQLLMGDAQARGTFIILKVEADKEPKEWQSTLRFTNYEGYEKWVELYRAFLDSPDDFNDLCDKEF